MPLSHILNGIHSTEENPMDVINGTLQKGETPRKKQVQNVQTKEVQTPKGKDIQKSTEVPRKVIFKKIYRPTELDQQIVLMRMLLLLVRARNTLLEEISMRVLSFPINKLFI